MLLHRAKLVAYRSSHLSPDTAERMRRLEMKAAERGNIRIVFEGNSRPPSWDSVRADPGPTGLPPWASMRPAGRELRIRAQIADYAGPPEALRQAEIEALWSVAVPLGLTPWTRYPLPGPGDDVFHFLGPWQGLYDHLCGEGLGELAWPSLCCAAQVDVARWEGDRYVERFVQAQVHRLGIPVGPIDGVITERVHEALRALGLGGLRLEEAAKVLQNMEPPAPPQTSRRIGHVLVPGTVHAVAYGKVAVSRTRNGYALTIDGPGRVVLDLDDGV